MQNLSLLDWSICGGYLVIVFALGLWFARGQHNTEDYFVGGRRMHWIPIGLSLFAGLFSSLSFVGLPSEAAYVDYHLYLSILFIPLVVTPIVWIWFLPLYFRLGSTSCYEYVERRFNRRLRLMASLLFMLYTLGWMGNLLRAVGVILQAVLDLSQMETAYVLLGVGLFATFYTTIGGVKAVVWTDVLQAFALGGGMILVLLLTVSRINGGWSQVWEIGSHHERFAMFKLHFDLQTPNIFGAIAFGFFVYLAGHAVTFTAVQRYVSMPSISAARKALVINGVMAGVVCLVFFLVGSAIFAFYHQSPDSNTAAVQTAETPPNLYYELQAGPDRPNRQDQLVPRFIMAELPYNGLMGLLLAGLFAAAMSSVDSGINSMSASVVCDWRTDQQLDLRQSKILCALFGLAAIALAISFYFYGGRVFPLIMKIAGTFLGLLLGLFVLGLLVKRANSFSATCGLAAGVACLALAFNFNVAHWWYGAVASVSVFIVGWLVSFLHRVPDAEA